MTSDDPFQFKTTFESIRASFSGDMQGSLAMSIKVMRSSYPEIQHLLQLQ